MTWIETSPEEREVLEQNWGNRIVMFSKQAGLACKILGDGTYWVYNGEWGGVRDGNEFLIDCEGITDDDLIVITDWQELRMGNFTPEERKHWYLPDPPEFTQVYNYDDEDDIAF